MSTSVGVSFSQIKHIFSTLKYCCFFYSNDVKSRAWFISLPLETWLCHTAAHFPRQRWFRMAQLGAAWVLLSSAPRVTSSWWSETRVTSLVCYTNTVVLPEGPGTGCWCAWFVVFFCVVFLPKSCKSDLHLFYQLLMLENMSLHPPSPQRGWSRAQSPAGSLLCWISQDDWSRNILPELGVAALPGHFSWVLEQISVWQMWTLLKTTPERLVRLWPKHTVYIPAMLTIKKKKNKSVFRNEIEAYN